MQKIEILVLFNTVNKNIAEITFDLPAASLTYLIKALYTSPSYILAFDPLSLNSGFRSCCNFLTVRAVA